MPNPTPAQKALAEIKTLEQTKKDIRARMPRENTGAENKRLTIELEAQLKRINNKIRELQKVVNTCVSPSNLVTPKSKTGTIAGGIIDAILRVKGGYNLQILEPKQKTIPIPVLTGVNAEVSFTAALEANFQLERSGVGVTGKADFTGKLAFGLGIALGFDIKYVGKFVIRIGIEGGPEIRAARDPIGISLTKKADGLTGTFGAAVFDIALSAQLYFETPLPESIISYVPAFIPKATTSGKTVNYPLGRLSIFEMRTYAFSLTYTSSKGFSYKVTAPNIGFTMAFKQKVQALYDGLIEMFNDAVNRLNPANWDLNPFN